MNLFRLILVVFLSFAVPFVATAGVVTPQIAEKCPMQSGGNSMAAMTQHDCCDTGQVMHSASEKSKPHTCKPGQECKICNACAVVQTVSATHHLPVASQIIVALPDSGLPSHDPRGLWRPPRSL